MLQQLAGLIGIARGFELDDLDIDVGSDRRQAPGNFFGLRQRHDALARAVTHCHHSRSVRRRAEPAADFRPEDIISSLL